MREIVDELLEAGFDHPERNHLFHDKLIVLVQNRADRVDADGDVGWKPHRGAEQGFGNEANAGRIALIKSGSLLDPAQRIAEFAYTGSISDAAGWNQANVVDADIA